MLSFVFQKIREKKWMFISLLIGNLLLAAVAAASPMYTNAVMQRTLTRDLQQLTSQTNQYPGVIQINNKSYVQLGMHYVERYDQAVQHMVQELDVPTLANVIRYGINGLKIAHGSRQLELDLAAYTGMESHVELIHGQMYAGELLDGGIIEVIVNERTLVEQELALGETVQLTTVQNKAGEPLQLRITGVFKNNDQQDLYWDSNPTQWNRVCLMDPTLFKTVFSGQAVTEKSPFGQWHVVLDYTQIKAERAGEIVQILSSYLEGFEEERVFRPFNVVFQETLERFSEDARRLNSTVLVLQIPIFVLLAAFIFMVSKQMLEIEQDEISVFKSRGAAKRQIILLYLLQSVLIAAVGLAGGIPLSIAICKLLGGTNDFLTFVQRAALSVKVDGKVLLYGGAAAVVSICTMVFPVLQASRVTIVDQKRKKNRNKKRRLWKLIGLDVILLAVSIYQLYQYRGQEAFLAEKFSSGSALDPTIYLCSALFMVGASLLFLRLLPYGIRLAFWVGKKLWPPEIYVSLLRMIRTSDNQGFMVVFLVLAMTLGVFSTQMARTINQNAEEKLQYAIGADVVLQEVWDQVWDYNEVEMEDSYSGPKTMVYVEPDFQKYLSIPGVEYAAKVLVDREASIKTQDGVLNNTMIMGINTKEFGQVAWLKDNLLPVHWYEYLNAISQDPNGILVSSNLKEQYGYRLGDVLQYTNENGDPARGVIYGFVDYWPTYAAVTRVLGSDGVYQETDQFLIVAHLSQLQSKWSITPYQVWLKMEGSTQAVYDFAAQKQIQFESFRDAAAERIDLKNDPVFQGTNGILTIGFLIVLTLCAAGFLIYWILSIRSRTLQFGIFRAMGMSGRSVLTMLIVEQLVISGTSICAGIGIGRVAASLYVPLIQVAYAGADKTLPLESVIRASDYLRLGVVAGTMLIVCMVILGVLISRIRISQALKLGED